MSLQPKKRKTRKKERPKWLDMHFIKDSTRPLHAHGYDSVMDDEFVCVKTVPQARTQFGELSGSQTIVMRKRDAQLFYISESELSRADIKTSSGNRFIVRMLTPTGHDEDLYLRLTEIEEENR